MPGMSVVGLGAVQLELDVLVELFEALVAEQLGLGRAEQPLQGVVVRVLAHGSVAHQIVEREAASCQVGTQLPPCIVKRLV